MRSDNLVTAGISEIFKTYLVTNLFFNLVNILAELLLRVLTFLRT